MLGKGKSRKHANKGKRFEKEVSVSNNAYKDKGIALIQEISTPWRIVRRGGRIVTATPKGKSTLDFRGTVNPGKSISFDCKETEDERGLPLANIQPHQIEYMRDALSMSEVTFILCFMKQTDTRYFIDGKLVISYWDRWQENKGKHGYNFIPVERMTEVTGSDDVVLHYLEPLGVHLD